MQVYPLHYITVESFPPAQKYALSDKPILHLNIQKVFKTCVDHLNK